jgi:hypothetical protein
LVTVLAPVLPDTPDVPFLAAQRQQFLPLRAEIPVNDRHPQRLATDF